MEIIILISLLVINLLVALFGLLFVTWLFQSYLFKAPFIPLPREVLEKVVKITNLSPGDTFYDLGSGDGRVVRAIAFKNPTVNCIGVERALLPSLLTWIYGLSNKPKNVRYLREDFRSVNLSEAKVLFLYLWPSVMLELSEKLRAELPIDAQIMSCRFTLPGFKLEATECVTINETVFKLYTYRNRL